jgi:intein-encoded DNA endonuclease-like protein
MGNRPEGLMLNVVEEEEEEDVLTMLNFGFCYQQGKSAIRACETVMVSRPKYLRTCKGKAIPVIGCEGP